MLPVPSLCFPAQRWKLTIVKAGLPNGYDQKKITMMKEKYSSITD
jgi:hypothetical protein